MNEYEWFAESFQSRPFDAEEPWSFSHDKSDQKKNDAPRELNQERSLQPDNEENACSSQTKQTIPSQNCLPCDESDTKLFSLETLSSTDSFHDVSNTSPMNHIWDQEETLIQWGVKTFPQQSLFQEQYKLYLNYVSAYGLTGRALVLRYKLLQWAAEKQVETQEFLPDDPTSLEFAAESSNHSKSETWIEEEEEDDGRPKDDDDDGIRHAPTCVMNESQLEILDVYGQKKNKNYVPVKKTHVSKATMVASPVSGIFLLYCAHFVLARSFVTQATPTTPSLGDDAFHRDTTPGTLSTMFDSKLCMNHPQDAPLVSSSPLFSHDANRAHLTNETSTSHQYNDNDDNDSLNHHAQQHPQHLQQQKPKKQKGQRHHQVPWLNNGHPYCLAKIKCLRKPGHNGVVGTATHPIEIEAHIIESFCTSKKIVFIMPESTQIYDFPRKYMQSYNSIHWYLPLDLKSRKHMVPPTPTCAYTLEYPEDNSIQVSPEKRWYRRVFTVGIGIDLNNPHDRVQMEVYGFESCDEFNQFIARCNYKIEPVDGTGKKKKYKTTALVSEWKQVLTLFKQHNHYVKVMNIKHRALDIYFTTVAEFKKQAKELVDRKLIQEKVPIKDWIKDVKAPLWTFVMYELNARKVRGFEDAKLQQFKKVMYNRGPALTWEQMVQLWDAYYWVHLAPEKRPEFQTVIDWYKEHGRYPVLKKPYERTGYNSGRTCRGKCRNFRGPKMEKYRQRIWESPWCKPDENQQFVPKPRRMRGGKRMHDISRQLYEQLCQIMDHSDDDVDNLDDWCNNDSKKKDDGVELMTDAMEWSSETKHNNTTSDSLLSTTGSFGDPYNDESWKCILQDESDEQEESKLSPCLSAPNDTVTMVSVKQEQVENCESSVQNMVVKTEALAVQKPSRVLGKRKSSVDQSDDKDQQEHAKRARKQLPQLDGDKESVTVVSSDTVAAAVVVKQDHADSACHENAPQSAENTLSNNVNDGDIMDDGIDDDEINSYIIQDPKTKMIRKYLWKERDRLLALIEELRNEKRAMGLHVGKGRKPKRPPPVLTETQLARVAQIDQEIKNHNISIRAIRNQMNSMTTDASKRPKRSKKKTFDSSLLVVIPNNPMHTNVAAMVE